MARIGSTELGDRGVWTLESYCSGVLIRPDVVLTAAHVRTGLVGAGRAMHACAVHACGMHVHAFKAALLATSNLPSPCLLCSALPAATAPPSSSAWPTKP